MNGNYDNRILTRAVLGMKSKRNFFQETFFSKSIQSQTKTVQLDIDAVTNGIAPVVDAASEGSLTSKVGFESKVLECAYFAPYVNITPADFMYRTAGNDPYVNNNDEMEVISRHLLNLKRTIENSAEKMCAEAVITGKISYEYKVGDNKKKRELDFDRRSEHKIALTGNSVWGGSQSDILGNIRSWRSLILKNAFGVQADTLVLGAEAAAKFFKDESIKDLFSASKYGIVKMEVSSDMPGLYHYGYIPGIGNVYEYESYYDKDGKAESVLDGKGIVYGSSNSGNFMAYGAIQSFEANPTSGLLPAQYYASFINKNSKNKIVQVESSFLPCLANVNAIVSGKVLE